MPNGQFYFINLFIFNREIDDETVEKTKEEVNNLLHSSEEDKKRLDALWEGKNIYLL